MTCLQYRLAFQMKMWEPNGRVLACGRPLCQPLVLKANRMRHELLVPHFDGVQPFCGWGQAMP